MRSTGEASYRQVAKRLGVSHATVRAIELRALEKLRAVLDPDETRVIEARLVLANGEQGESAPLSAARLRGNCERCGHSFALRQDGRVRRHICPLLDEHAERERERHAKGRCRCPR